MRRHHTRRLVGKREPTSWLRQLVETTETESGTVLGGDIFDMTTMGILGDGEDFRCTVLRIRASVLWEQSGSASGNTAVGINGTWGVALVGTDSGIPDPTLTNLVDTQTDWLALGAFRGGEMQVSNGVDLRFADAFEFDVKAKRKVSIGEHLVLAVKFNTVVSTLSDVTIHAPVSVLWQRTLR